MTRSKPSSRRRLATQKTSLERSFNVSVAGARAGGGLMLGSLKRRFGMAGKADSESAVLQRESERFAAELGKLKGSYVKIGQLFAQFGEHFLPHELTQALHELGSSTEALPWDSIEPHCRESLGERRFAELDIEPEAIAAASLAQVHAAHSSVSLDDAPENLVLKILYPGLRDSIDTDFDAVVRMLKLGRFVQLNRDLDVWMEQLREQLHLEADYSREAAMTRRVAELAAELCNRSTVLESGSLRVPKVVERYCQGEVLALEKMQGFSITTKTVQSLSQRRRNQIARAQLELFFAEVFCWGLIQTDPNFGNYIVQPAAKVTGPEGQPDALVLLDFGAMQEMPIDFLENFRQAIASGLSDDKAALIEALKGLSCLAPDCSSDAQASLASFCVAILEPLWPAEKLPESCLNNRGDYQWADSRLMKRAGKMAAGASLSRHFALPGVEFTLIARKLIGVFTFISVLGAEFNGHSIARRYIDEWQERDINSARR